MPENPPGQLNTDLHPLIADLIAANTKLVADLSAVVTKLIADLSAVNAKLLESLDNDLATAFMKALHAQKEDAGRP